jgi:diadenosine tetraphosphate (Ap4A) HIT family hydrolase
MTNPTALKFGYPRTKVAETDRWLLLARPQQPTFGSLVLVCKEPVQAFGDVSSEAFGELKAMTANIERLLKDVVGYEKINYLMLMMVDSDVHFHVIPRYEGERIHAGRAFADAGWPGQPDLSKAVALSESEQTDLAQLLTGRFS